MPTQHHKGLTLFSDEPHPRVWFTLHYRNPSRRNPEPLQRSWGTHPQLNRGLPNQQSVTITTSSKQMNLDKTQANPTNEIPQVNEGGMKNGLVKM